MKKILIFLGPPGSGKGTQAKKIAAKYDYYHLSTGDLLRDLVKNPDAATDEKVALEEMRHGKLVPDWLIYRLAFREIERNIGEGRGVILDGAIRNFAQAQEYQRFFVEKNLAMEVMTVEVALPDADCFNRLFHRRVCSVCGEIIPGNSKVDKCPKCGNALVSRADDTEEVIRKRIAEQGNTAIAPVRDFYRELEVLQIVDGTKSIEEVQQNIEKLIC